MENYDFNMYDTTSSILQDEFVVLQAGKGKKEDSTKKIDAKSFSYVEGIIWDKYREYGTKVKTKIPSPEWERILEGFGEAVDKLDIYIATDKLEEILKFNIMNAQQPLDEILGLVDELKAMMISMTDWVTLQTAKENYIYIIKK